MRAKDARDAFGRSSSPLVPASWTAAARDMVRYIRVLMEQIEAKQHVVARSERQGPPTPRSVLFLTRAIMLLVLLRTLATRPLGRAYVSRRTRAVDGASSSPRTSFASSSRAFLSS